MKVTVLGSGGSGGVPLLGGDWGRCNPANPKNRRRRVSVLIESDAAKILIDTSPDLRAQLLDAKTDRLDGVLYTHDHADHSHGIDELRYLGRGGGTAPLPVFGTRETLASLEQRFGYAFRQRTDGSGSLYRPFLAARTIDGPFQIGDQTITPFEQGHGFGSVTTGFRVGPMAYSTDVVQLADAAFEALKGLELWIVDCLRFEPHPTHAHFDLAISWIERVRPRRAVLTHLNHQTDFDEVASRCPPGVEPAYDGLVVEIAA